MKLVEMFSSRATAPYPLTPNYAYQTCYPSNYDTCTVNATNQLTNADNVANGNYQQNLHGSWPSVCVSNASASRPQGLYDDLFINVNHYNTNHYQNQPVSYNAYHLQRSSADIPPANFSIQGSISMDGHDGLVSNRTDGHPSPESIVAVSSDGLSGTESPEISMHINQNSSGVICRPQPARSPFEWMKRTSYQSQPNPETFESDEGQERAKLHPGLVSISEQSWSPSLRKTRTKDKYRVVYTDHQRLELEKEFHYSRYITIRRKSELATLLGLSERQVKIWFQNRRAKDRKQAKKREEIDQKNKDVILHQTNAINISSLNFALRPLTHFDHDNNSRSIAMFQNGDHLCK